MSNPTQTQFSTEEPTIVMTRIYDAPRALVWEAFTDPQHVKNWWGGAGCENRISEMDVRPGGRWKHLMRFPDGLEIPLDFVFVEVEKPARLVWQNPDFGQRKGGAPASRTTITLEELGGRTRWTMLAEFQSMADREVARGMGFTKPIEASGELLSQYLGTMEARR
jgi:uncharacterized protein YndB with AHSA1/START domain